MCKLTSKQRKFCDEYIKTGNASRSYVEAGYSMKSNKAIRSEAWKLLRKPHVKAYIEQKLDEIHSAKIADAQEVLEYLTSVVRGQQTESVATAKGVYDNVPVSAKDRINAGKEILKRYPNDPFSKAQLRKLKADTELTETKNEILKSANVNEDGVLNTMLDELKDGVVDGNSNK